MSVSTRKKMIIDTDTGVDDAVALFMALDSHKRGEVEVLAITAVTGNCSGDCAETNILRVLDTAGCSQIPVYRGAPEALVIPYDNTQLFHGHDGFNDVEFDNVPDKKRIIEEMAWDAINRITTQFPGEVTLVALGPLTNVALAMKTDTNLVTRLKEIFIMGGNIEGMGNVTPTGEFNFLADPEAAYTVLRMTRCPTYISTWELSYKYNHVDFSWRKEVLGSLQTPAAVLINKLEQVWFNNWPWGDNWVLCDELAMMAALCRDSIKQFSKHRATVELSGNMTRGMMVLDQRVDATEEELIVKNPNIIVINKLDIDMLKTYLYRAFSQ